MNKYGSRPVMIVGGCLSGCGLIAASFCTTVQELYLCVGVIAGELLLMYFQALIFVWTIYSINLPILLKNESSLLEKLLGHYFLELLIC